MSNIVHIASDVEEALIEAYHTKEDINAKHAIIILLDQDNAPEVSSTLDYQDTLAVLNSII